MKKIYTILLSLIFCITAMAQTPVMTMTTTNPVGSAFSVNVELPATTLVQVDFGDGNLVNFNLYGRTNFSGTLKGSTVKIYGSGIIYLYCYSHNLTSLDVSKNPYLKELVCGDNPIHSLDVTQNTALTSLICEKNALTTLDVTKNTALTRLNCGYNQLTAIDVSKNTALTFLDCSNNPINSLDVSQNKALQYLQCSTCRLATLNLSQNSALLDLRCQSNFLTELIVTQNTALTTLYCFGNKLTTLYLVRNTALKELNCHYNQISALDISKNTQLSILYIVANKFTLNTLPLPNASLTSYDYDNQQPFSISKDFDAGTNIDLSNQLTINGNTTNYKWRIKGATTYLVEGTDYKITNGVTVFLKVPIDSVRCELRNATFPQFDDYGLTSTYTKIHEIPVMSMTTAAAIGSTISFSLRSAVDNTPVQIDFGNGVLVNNSIGKSDTKISGTLVGSQTVKIYGSGISTFFCEDNQFTALDVTKNRHLTYLSCNNNQLSTLKVNNPNLNRINCENNKLTSLDVTNCPILSELSCRTNQITSIDLTKNTGLYYLQCMENQLTTLDLGKNTKLNQLLCTHNKITSLDLSNNTELTFVYCYYNQLTTLNINKCTKLETLSCGNNQISSLNLSDNVALENFDCDHNHLTALNVTKNVAIIKLNCGDNRITTLDLTKNTALTEFSCYNNLISALDFTQNTALTQVLLQNNLFSFASLPLKKATWTRGYNYAPQNPVSIAKSIKTGVAIDLSNQYSINGNNTVYTWKTKGGTSLVENTDYTATDGKTTFINGQADSVYCEMTNVTFPDFKQTNILNTTCIQVLGSGSQVQTITFNALAAQIVYSPDLTVNASTTSSLPITFTSSDPLVAKVSGNKVSLLKAGSVTISANQVGNTTWAPASVSQTLVINKRNQTISFTAVSAKKINDAPFKLAASSLSGLPVTFSSSDPNIASISNDTVKIHKAGTITVTANQAGDDNWASATETQTLVINKQDQTITFNALSEKNVNDAPFGITASASSKLMVTFTSSDPTVASISGSTVTILNTGTVTITAAQAGNDSYNAATATQTLTITTKTSQTITFNALADKKVNDASFDLVASASSSLPVTFTSSDPSVASINGKTVTILKAGTVTITASQAGNTTWNAAVVSQTLTINKVAQTITFSAIAEKFANAAPFQLTASSNSGLLVSFTSSDPSVASISGNTVTILKAGTVTITAAQDGNNMWGSATAVQTLTIKKAAQTITFKALPVKNVNDASFELTASASSGLSVTFTISDPTVASVSGNKVIILKIGTTTITATQVGDDIWEAATVSQSLFINNKQSQTITFNALPDKKATDASFELTTSASSALPITYTISDPSVASISGSTVTILKAGTITITATQAGNDNWNPATAEQTLTITSVTGINEEKQVELIAYPNPATDMLYLKGEKIENSNVSIFNQAGTIVFIGIVKHKSINISQLPAGLYIIKISNKDKEDISIRFVKQ